ncbi:hypothetical protein SLS56_005935 [Neofusicoccum ribis]|uniref:Uncharacterized protein n=1 Tax=Neofusicoccum ribis TaxID=45134 RepID=A0ABR3STZ1_9PEZI
MPSSTKSSASTSSGMFSRFALTNPFASDKTATEDKNSRRKSSTTLLSSMSLNSPAFKMTKKVRSRKDSGGTANASTASLADGSVEESEEAIGSSGTMGGRPASRASAFSLKRTPSSVSLGRMLGDKLKKATGGKPKTSSGKAPEGGERSESRASSTAGGGPGLTRSNAVSSRPHSRKGSWRSSWGGGAALGLTSSTTDSASGSTSNRHSANSTASHVSFASTNASDAPESNSAEGGGGAIKGFRRRKTSSTLHGLVPGWGMGMGLGGSGLEMTPAPAAATARDGGDAGGKKPPSTSDGVLTTSAPTDGTTAAVAADDNSKASEEGEEQQQQSTQQPAGRGHKKSSSTDTLTRRIKLNRTRRDSSPPASRARSKSDGTSSLLATSSKLLAIRSSRRLSLHTAATAAAAASTTALRAPSTSSESGMSLPSAVAGASSGFAGFIGHPTGVTALSSPNLLLFDSGSGNGSASGSGSGRNGRAVVDAGDKFTAAWCSAGASRDPPPTLPELPAGDGCLLGEFEMPRIECVEGAGGRTDWVDLRTGRLLEGPGEGELGVTEGARRDGGRMAVQRVLENRKRVVVASDRMDSGGEAVESEDGLVDDQEAEGRGKGVFDGEAAPGADPDGAMGGQLVLARENDATPSLTVDEGDPSASPRSITPRASPGRFAAEGELVVRGRATLVDSTRLHDKVLPSSSSSVYSTPGTSPPTSSGTPVPPENDYVKDIETEIVDDRWVDYGPMNEIRMLES